MKRTLLDLTQNILSALDGEEVNSFSDTTESRQVAEIIRNTYYNIINRADLPEHKGIFSLVASTDGTKPVLMTKPSDVVRIEWIKYFNDEQEDYEYVTLIPLAQFLDFTQGGDPTDTTTGILVFDDKNFYYSNDGQPTLCTILNNNTVLFNSYDSTYDDTLQASKTMVFGQRVPVFEMEDSFYPELDAQQFPLLLTEAKATAFLELKQVANDLALRESKRQWNNLQRVKDLRQDNPLDSLPNFGRR